LADTYETLSYNQINKGTHPTHPVGQGGLERVLVGHQELGGHSEAYSNSNSPHTLTVDRPVGALKSHQKVDCTGLFPCPLHPYTNTCLINTKTQTNTAKLRKLLTLPVHTYIYIHPRTTYVNYTQ